MATFFLILAVIAIFGVLAVFLAGVFGMTKGSEFEVKYANKLMQARVGLQAVAIGCLLLAALCRGLQ